MSTRPSKTSRSSSVVPKGKKKIPKSYLREEAESILYPKNEKEDDCASIWTSADDKSIAHLEFETTASDEFPLPPGWAKVYSVTHNKWFFANANTQSTSWIDPRDSFWKKATWEECDPKTDETPFGWEIAHDQVVGVYFIDHINHINTMDDPRVNKFELQLNMLHYFFAVERDGLMASKKAVLADRVQDMNAIELSLRSEKGNESLGLDNDTEIFSQGQYSAVSEVKARYAEVNEQVAELKQELDDMAVDTSDLEQMTRRMEMDNHDQIRTQKLLQAEIENKKKDFVEQAIIRKAYEEDLELLMSIEISTTAFTECPPPPERQSSSTPDSETFNDFADLESGIQTPSPKSTRLEREMSLLELKKQIRAITRQNAQLEKITTSARRQLNSALGSITKAKDFVEESNIPIVPSWVKLITEYISNEENKKYSELELKAKRNEELTFKEKITLLATSTNETWSNLKA